MRGSDTWGLLWSEALSKLDTALSLPAEESEIAERNRAEQNWAQVCLICEINLDSIVCASWVLTLKLLMGCLCSTCRAWHAIIPPNKSSAMVFTMLILCQIADPVQIPIPTAVSTTTTTTTAGSYQAASTSATAPALRCVAFRCDAANVINFQSNQFNFLWC